MKLKLFVAFCSILEIVGFTFIAMKILAKIYFVNVTPLIIAIGGLAAVIKWFIAEKTDEPPKTLLLTRLAGLSGLGLIVLTMLMRIM